MANKFLNVLIDGVQTPINIDDVVAVQATKGVVGGGSAAAGKVEIFYASGKKATITASGQTNATTWASDAENANVQKGFWEAIIDAQAYPWNMVIYPSPGVAWDQTYSPDPTNVVEYSKAALNNSVLQGKSSKEFVTVDGSAVLWASVVIS